MSKRSIESDKMSCTTVMYQPYSLSSSYTVCDRPPSEKKPFRFPYVPSPPDSLHSDGSTSYSHSSPGPNVTSITNNTSPLSLNLNANSTSSSSSTRRPLTPVGGPLTSFSSSAPATITSASQLLQIQQQQQQHQNSLRSPHARNNHNHTHSHNNGSATATSSSSSSSATITSHTHPHLLSEEEQSQGVNNENDGSRGGSGPEVRTMGSNRVQYLSANCIVYENYREETARVVEDHFNRALSAGSTTKCSPMSTRNFPPSFWNSNYQPLSQPNAVSSKPFANMGSYGASDFYGAAVDYGSTLSGLSHHQSDPWHYPLSTHQGYHHRADLSYPPMPSTSRFNAAQYGSFFLAGAAATSSAASRFAAGAGQCGANLKGDASTWSSGLYHHPHESLSELNLADYAAAAHYTNRTAGLETAAVGQESAAKDPYWF